MTKEEFEARIDAWHRGEGFGIPLNEFLGCSVDQMQAYVLRGEIPAD